jgi:hypothetical protein
MSAPRSDKQLATPPARRRNAGTTREAILRSALVAFTRHGYDGAGVREIAHRGIEVGAVRAVQLLRLEGAANVEVVEVSSASTDRPDPAHEPVAAGALVAAEPRSADGFLPRCALRPTPGPLRSCETASSGTFSAT